MRCLVNEKDGEAKKLSKFLSHLTQNVYTNNSILHHTVDAIIACFSPIRPPMMMKVLPILEDIKQNLCLLSDGVSQSNYLPPPHHLTINLATVCLDRINAIYIDDM